METYTVFLISCGALAVLSVIYYIWLTWLLCPRGASAALSDNLLPSDVEEQ